MNKQQLAAKIWESANKMRSKIEANELYEDISELFSNAGIENFEKLPSDISVCRKFAKDFKELNS